MAVDLLPDLPSSPKLRLHIHDLTHEATSVFLSLIDCKSLIPDAVKHIIRHLYTPYGRASIPPVRSVTIILRGMGGVAYTTGLELDDLHKEIHISLAYLANFCNEPVRFEHETLGVITHEMVHCFQHNGRGAAPGGLIEGIADYVRLKAGLAPPHWKKDKGRMGEKWDAGYERTAWFLEWLEEKEGVGTVSKINQTLATTKYDNDTFWKSLFGQGVEALWESYKEELAGDSVTNLDEDSVQGGSDTGGVTGDNSEGSEPELIDLSPADKEEAQAALRKQVRG
ncbi:hypothetical protein DV737_g5747, partial [Chaetothyriales sp. CBS 132003]